MKKFIHFLSIALCAQICAMEQPENNSPQIHKSNLMAMQYGKTIDELIESLNQYSSRTIELFKQKMNDNNANKVDEEIRFNLHKSKNKTEELVSCLQQFPQNDCDLNKKIYTSEKISNMIQIYEVRSKLLDIAISLVNSEETIEFVQTCNQQSQSNPNPADTEKTKEVIWKKLQSTELSMDSTKTDLVNIVKKINAIQEDETKVHLMQEQQSMHNLYLLLTQSIKGLQKP